MNKPTDDPKTPVLTPHATPDRLWGWGEDSCVFEKHPQVILCVTRVENRCQIKPNFLWPDSQGYQ